jgi:acetyl-CoA carboxylase, biotin carboxylase subunit
MKNKINKILIANRGEIAVRIISACGEMGIATVAVYSDADENSLHRELADQSVHIGESPATESYLDMDKIVNAAKESGADAIHPGYGFLSENPEFNKKVRDSGLIFIGPEPDAMKVLGSKVESRIKMMEAGVPVVPGMGTSSLDIQDFVDSAKEIGYPVLVKASDGGGGKGMRIVRTENELKSAVESSIRESKSSFGSDKVFLEKYIENPRHIEIQVARDSHGNARHFFERECSVQRRHQKIIEETPSTALSNEIRGKMCSSAIKAVEAVDYHSVATVEFLLDEDGSFYFLEVNTRIQVEHPVTEMVTGRDLVKLQIEIGRGEKIDFSQDEITSRGHSIECRIYAEDAERDFMPTGGKILLYNEPSGIGIRVDSGVREGDEISSYYDPIMAKLITYGQNREEARRRMIRALAGFITLGVKTSTEFLSGILSSEDFISGKTFTSFLDKNYDLMNVKRKYLDEALLVASQEINKSTILRQNNNSNNSNTRSVWEEVGGWEVCQG